MKRYIWIAIGIVYVWVSFWQNTHINQDNVFQTWEQTKIVTQAIKWDTINDLNLLWAKFCNNWLEFQKRTNQLQLQMQPGQKKYICMVFYNISLEKVINVRFAFSSTDINKEWNITCDDDMTTKNEFSKFIDQTHNRWFIIPPNSRVIKKMRIDIPTNYTGNILNWCLSYKINKEETMDPWQMFLFTYRKTAPIAITITWDVYSFWRQDDIKHMYAVNKWLILKSIAVILGLWIIITIVHINHKKEKPHKKNKL